MDQEQLLKTHGALTVVRRSASLSAAVASVAFLVIYASGQTQVNTSFLPLNVGPEWKTCIRLVNREDQPISIALSAHDDYGRSLAHQSSINHLGSREVRNIEANPTIATLRGTLKLESSRTYAAAVVIESLDGQKADIVPAIRQTATDLFFPVLFAGDHRSKTVTVTNADSTPAHLDIIALAKDGSELHRTFFPLLPSLATQTFTVERLFDSQTLEQMAAVRIISDHKLAGLQTIDPPDRDLVALPALTDARRESSLPVPTSADMRGLWTKVGVFNPGLTSTSVLLKAFDSEHNSLGVFGAAILRPHETHVFFD